MNPTYSRILFDIMIYYEYMDYEYSRILSNNICYIIEYSQSIADLIILIQGQGPSPSATPPPSSAARLGRSCAAHSARSPRRCDGHGSSGAHGRR